VFIHPTVTNRQKTFSDRCIPIGIQCQKLDTLSFGKKLCAGKTNPR
jgi:hypothetical protein